jgi:hypothetical protein
MDADHAGEAGTHLRQVRAWLGSVDGARQAALGLTEDGGNRQCPAMKMQPATPPSRADARPLQQGWPAMQPEGKEGRDRSDRQNCAGQPPGGGTRIRTLDPLIRVSASPQDALAIYGID